LSVTLGVTSSIANDVIMRMMIIAGLWRCGDWRHVTTGCNAIVIYLIRLSSAKGMKVDKLSKRVYFLCPLQALPVPETGRSTMQLLPESGRPN